MEDLYQFDRHSHNLKRRPITLRSRFCNHQLAFSELANRQLIHFNPHPHPPDDPDFQNVYIRPLSNFKQVLPAASIDGILLIELNPKILCLLQLTSLKSLPWSYPLFPRSSWRRFWNSSFPQKAHIILWRCYHNKLSTKEHLNSRSAIFFVVILTPTNTSFGFASIKNNLANNSYKISGLSSVFNFRQYQKAHQYFNANTPRCLH